MEIIRKLAAKAADIGNREGVTIAFLGDSVTQGCFEVYYKNNGAIETIFDKRYSYEAYVFELLCMLYPSATVNIINAGISGDNAENGARRVDEDALAFHPDLLVVSYGLNDAVSGGSNGIKAYAEDLRIIFE
ncbi:MAG: SGNH/GDSL hydrolase family protein, partial [Clostridia bacterium]|nr:SGNH/GDSL hydrolase family protein [Clostridia bacterium]